MTSNLGLTDRNMQGKICLKVVLKFDFRLCFNPIYKLEAMGTLLKIFMGLALVSFQKYWLLSNIKMIPYSNILGTELFLL